MAEPVLYLNRDGDGFKSGIHKGRGGEDFLNGQDAHLVEMATACKTHTQVLEFLDYLGSPLQTEDLGRTHLYHTHNPEYRAHDLGKGAAHRCALPQMMAFVEQRRIDADPSIPQGDKMAALITSHPFSDIRGLLQNYAKVQVSFWGSRTVSFDVYEGTVTLDRLAQEILKAAQNRCLAEDMTVEERIEGLGIVACLDELYKTSDQLVAESNWFTRLFTWLRELTFSPKTTPRFQVTDDIVGMHFRGFSKERYESEIGDPEQAAGSFGTPNGPFYCVSQDTLMGWLEEEEGSEY